MIKLPVRCPSCSQQLQVTKLTCTSCETQVIGQYQLSLFSLLDVEEQEFILQFLLSSGSLKEMANQMGKSYPTVRNKLDDLIEKINHMREQE